MAHTYTNIAIHALFSTKNRVPHVDPELKRELHPYMGGVLRNLKAKTIALNGPADHVHFLAVIPPTLCVAELMGKVKSNSSGWVHEKWPARSDFAWQIGYTAFSVSQSNIEAVRKYIENQEAHHRKVSFKEELIAFLKKHGVAYDERYVFD